MAFVTGTATDHQDLYDKLINFLTTNATLVGLNQEWSVVWGSGNELMLQGPGLSATDEILVGLKLNEDALNDLYSISLCGATGILIGATAFDGHVNPTPDPARMFLENTSMQYWFVANGRRFSVVVKVSTVYQSCYAGYFLPYSPPANYSYPVFIGGSAGTGAPTPFSAVAPDWRDVTDAHSLFPYSKYDGSASFEPSAKMIDPQGQWLRCCGFPTPTDGDVGLAPSQFFDGGDLMPAGSVSTPQGSNPGLGYFDVLSRVEACYGGEFTLTPITLVQKNPADQTYGVLQGVYHVTGRDNFAENIITVSGLNHLVVPNAFRSGPVDYFALALE